MSKIFIIFLIFLIFFNILICYLANSIANFFKIIDYPTKNRKIHSNPTPLIGGIIFFTNFLLFIFFDIFTGVNDVTGSQLLFDIRIISIKQLFIFIGTSISIYIIGFYDDVYDTRPSRKILIFILFLYVLILSNPNLLIKELNFFNFENSIYFNNFSIYFTIFCIIAFMNAANMFDGINLQSPILYFSFLLIFLFKDLNHDFLIVFFISLIFYSYMNFKGKIFLGNNGSYFLSFLISIILIADYNWRKNYFIEEIFLYLLLPGIDMIRLCILRIIKNKSPFEGDNNHFHHLLLKKFNHSISIFILSIMIFLPIFLFNYFEINPLKLIIVLFLVYLTILLICLKKGTK